tara:strand:- start:24614 stop:25588 length:975 start_codon:yes stop_codon:yes gene_type:complete
MQEIDNKNQFKGFDDRIDLRELFFILIKGKKVIISFTAFLSIIGLIYSLMLPNIYESETLLVSVDSSANDSFSGALRSYSGLAGLAGINLPTGSNNSNSAKAIETMSSLSFFENNIMPKIFLPDLMAIKSWNYETNSITYDNDIFDVNSNKWVRDFSYPEKLIPSAQESFEEYIDDHINVIEDKETGFVSLSVKHQSPYLAKQWADLIVEEVNTFYRLKDKAESEKAVAYLNEQMALTRLSETKQVIAELIQKEIQKLTLIEANEAYVFDYIYPPSVMERNSEPSRVLIFFLFTFLGFVIGALIILFKNYSFVEEKEITEQIGN